MDRKSTCPKDVALIREVAADEYPNDGSGRNEQWRTMVWFDHKAQISADGSRADLAVNTAGAGRIS
jgi:hypothetical protein